MKTTKPLAASRSPQVTGTILVERILIGGLTTLIIARLLVASDDPGRLRLTSGGGPLTLNLLSFLLLVAWSVWRGWTRRPFTRGPGIIVPLGLLAVAGLVFASAARPDRYQHPSWFIAWDWAAIAVLCFLTWQLARTPAIVRGLTAVLIATAVSLTAQALYQEAAPSIKLPAAEAELSPEGALPLVGDDEFGFKLDEPAPPRGRFRATFAQPDTLACLLLLLVPALLGWGVAGWRLGGRSRLALICAVLIVTGAMLAWRQMIGSPNIAVKVNLFELIHQFTWFGVGPGNLSRMVSHGPVQPDNFWLSLAATAGVPALAIAGLTVLISLWHCTCQRNRLSQDAVELPTAGTRWEFYIGGVAGLLLGMMLATGDIPAEAPPAALLRLGAVAAGRALIWFLTYALFEGILIGQRPLKSALGVGALLVACAGFVSDGLASPALLQSFAVVLILSLQGAANRPEAASPIVLWAWACTPIAAALLLANFVHVTLPGLSTASAIRSAREASNSFPYSHWQTAGGRGSAHLKALAEAKGYLEANILQQLRTAADNDPGNSALLLEQARWDRWHWRYRLDLQEAASAKLEALEMLRLAKKAGEIDPRNPAVNWSIFKSLLLFTGQNLSASKEQLASLEKYIGLITNREPTREVELRFDVIMSLLKRQNQEIVDSWAVQLLRLNAEENQPHGHLTDDQRSRLFDALRKVLPKPSVELKEFLGLAKR